MACKFMLNWKKFHPHNKNDEIEQKAGAKALLLFIFHYFCPKCDNRHGDLSHS